MSTRHGINPDHSRGKDCALSTPQSRVLDVSQDFEGQKLAERIYRVVAVVAAVGDTAPYINELTRIEQVVAFIVGYISQSMFACFAVFGGLIAALLLVCFLPYRRVMSLICGVIGCCAAMAHL